MIYNDTKTSLLVEKQLPEFIRDNPDYANFTLFLKAYYEWLETSNTSNSQITTTNSSGQGVTFATKNLLTYKDVDETIDGFTDYFLNDFLPNFPKETLISKQQAVKVARELYQTKGTPSSYQFLFRILYDSDFEVFYTKDAVFKPSDGIWYVAKSLKLATNDPNFRNVNQYRIFGETSKSLATIENAVLAGTKTEIFISNIERLFESGEYVRVIDNKNQDVLFNGTPLRAKVVGQISSVNIDPQNRGLTYDVGDPVIVYGGLNTDTGHGAVAQVSKTTKGSVKDIQVSDGGYGYTADPQTTISIVSDTGQGAQAVVTSLDPNIHKTANVTFLSNNSLGLAWSTHIDAATYSFLLTHPTANANTSLANGLDFITFTTYPIGSVIVTNGGGGYSKVPIASAKSLYFTQYANYPTAELTQIGILAPLQIINPGNGYRANDKITITGGSGYGAYANVITVAANGAITNVSYVYDSTGHNIYPLGGMGYLVGDKNFNVSIASANASATGAQLVVPGILGTGAELTVDVDRAGSVTTIQLLDPGEDYVSTPTVSLKVQDILVSNVSVSNLPQIGDTVYQGMNMNVATYFATVNSVSLLQPYNNPADSLYNLRVFEYNSNPNSSRRLTIDKTLGQINMIMANNTYGGIYNQYGYKNYGDGAARASAKFLNGLVVSQGQYLNQQGQPSSFSVLQDQKYNNYTYQITVNKEIEKYRSILLNLLHPSGTNVVGRMIDSGQVYYSNIFTDALYKGYPLYSATGGIGQTGATATMVADFTNASNNIVQFNSIPGSVNLANVIFANQTTLKLESNIGINVSSLVTHVDYTHNKVTLESNTWLTFANVVTVTGNTGQNTINIHSITGTYDLVNNGLYSNTAYPLMDIIGPGDRIQVANNSTLTVSYVDYTTGNGVIHLTTNLSSTTNSSLSVSRTLLANSNFISDQIHLYGPIGTSYIPELATENGNSLTTEDNRIILLG